ncbi:MAG: hypothetical protein QOE33_2266 [Acidobacteriota bacterium]|nr:hypothetical protein [Acidobacteriota bacterium]
MSEQQDNSTRLGDGNEASGLLRSVEPAGGASYSMSSTDSSSDDNKDTLGSGSADSSDKSDDNKDTAGSGDADSSDDGSDSSDADGTDSGADADGSDS